MQENGSNSELTSQEILSAPVDQQKKIPEPKLPLKERVINFLDNLVVYGLGFLAFAIAVGFYLKTYDSCQIKITIFQIGGSIIIGLWLIKTSIERKILITKEQRKILYPVLVFALWGIISYLLTDFRGAAFEELTKRIIYVGIFVIISLDFNEKKRNIIISFLITATLVSTIYGLIQFFDTRFWPPNPAHGLDPFIWRQAFGKRIFSTFGNPTFYAGYLILVFSLFFSLLWNNQWKKWFIGIVLLLILFNLRFTFISLSLLSFLIGFFICLILIKKDVVTEKYKKILLMVFIFLVFLFFVLGIFLYRGKGELIRYKKAIFSATIEMIKDKPILGSGIGTFRIVYPAYRKPEIFLIEGRHNTETDHAENEFLEIWSEEGIVGLLIFLWFLFEIFSNTIKKLKSEIEIAEKVLLIGLFSGIITFWINSLYRGVSYYFVAPGFFVWVLTGITANIIVSPKYSETPQKWEGFRVLICAVGIVLIPFSILYFPRYFIADVHHNIAIFHSKRGEWEKALKHYNLVLENNPNYIMTHYFMGNVYNDRWNAGDPERALQKYEDVKKLAPNYVQVHYQVATIYAKLEKWEKAIENYNKYLEIDPVWERTYPLLAMAYAQLGKYKKAEETFIAGLKWHPESADMFLGLGNICYAQKKFKSAERFYKKVLEIKPNNREAIENLKILYKKTKK
ncbi:MAG: tetratricopeptide repeat protein [Elusimicrobia bacterium]|nr:tetratricopeptide repeat protein [Elusimicrobiota bacterium]